MQGVNFLSELYALDALDASGCCLLAEYPSSNSGETCFQNTTRFLIHDPFPPPARELMKVLGPHHLMCGWGQAVPVASEIAPPAELTQHWARMLGEQSIPRWTAPQHQTAPYITLFPHESVPPERQIIDPVVNYELHSKQVIEKIACPQAEVLDGVSIPCVVKLTHGYAGLGNFMIRSHADKSAMQAQLKQNWPAAKVVVNSMIENIVGDYGVQFYLRSDGTTIWLGVTEQNFNQQQRWCGGVYRSTLQKTLLDPMLPFVQATAAHLGRQGYHGVVGIDVLQTGDGSCFLVDVNPRLTGISPFLMASRMFDREDGMTEGVYRASCRYAGSLTQLIEAAEKTREQRGVKVLVLSASQAVAENGAATTICHLSASAGESTDCHLTLDKICG